jgi:hypothetical protein
MTNKISFLGIFSYLDTLLTAVTEAKQAGVTVHTVFSPTPRHEISDALGLKPSPIRYFTLCGGILGMIGGFSLAVYSSVQWNIIVGGRPVIAWVPFVIVGFECTILLGVLATVVGMLIYNRLPRIRIPDYYDPRFTEDKFGILVVCPEEERGNVTRLLQEAGAEELHEVEQ